MIKPLKKILINKKFKTNNIVALDIETVTFNNKQVPVVLTMAYNRETDGKLIKVIECMNYDIFNKDNVEANKELWIRFTNHFKALSDNTVIFTHNLGKFDGYFIFDGLIDICKLEDINSLISKEHEFIQIVAKIHDKQYIFKDSLRIFPVSLKDLCEIFEIVDNKLEYQDIFNNLSVLTNKSKLKEFLKYSIKDSVILLKALKAAQKLYIEKYSVDITTIWSTSTLSLKIFRKNHLEFEIPTLDNTSDDFIRQAYFGGGVDYYYRYGENLYYYDVNSLYPWAMCQELPFEVLKYHASLRRVNLENFYGFCLAEVTSPSDIEIPLLIQRSPNYTQTIYPQGTWSGVYFSEELKAVQKYGYKIKLIRGYEFDHTIIFKDYVDHFYEIKKNSEGPLRFISKMQLNQLYGYFGRSKDILKTANVKSEDLEETLLHRVIESIVQVRDNIYLILMHKNLNYNVIKDLNTNLPDDYFIKFRDNIEDVKSNVAIAAAITSYGRIKMIDLKMLLIKKGYKIYYSDTDSIITDKPLPHELIGKELGQLKDELDGGIIEKGYFMGIKQYGYVKLNKNNVRSEHSVFAGVTRDSISFEEIEKLVKGQTITKTQPIFFARNFNDLSIRIFNDRQIHIKMNSFKELYNNKYITPDYYTNIAHNVAIKLIAKMKYFLKKYLQR